MVSLRRALAESKPTYAACVFDGPGETWRHRELPGYKAGRKPMPDELRAALPAIRAAVEDTGVRCIEVAATEADDVIATIATKVAAHGGCARIVSTDRAFHALLSEQISVRDHFARKHVTPADVVERHGVAAGQLVDLWALCGFGSSGIDGVPGIGPKTAIKLLREHGDLDRILAAAPTIGGRAGKALTEHVAQAHRSRRLAALRIDLDVGINLRDLRFTRPEARPV